MTRLDKFLICVESKGSSIMNLANVTEKERKAIIKIRNKYLSNDPMGQGVRVITEEQVDKYKILREGINKAWNRGTHIKKRDIPEGWHAVDLYWKEDLELVDGDWKKVQCTTIMLQLPNNKNFYLVWL